jgi:hypothetical protein
MSRHPQTRAAAARTQGRRRGAPAHGAVPAKNSAVSLVLAADERRLLLEALDDEQQAWTLYDQVIRDFGPQRPFIHIREAEARHIAALQTLFERYHVRIPRNPWPGRVARYATAQEACAAAVEAEIANGDLLQRLAARATRPDVLAVLRNLQRASARHLAAFQRCATRHEGGGRRLRRRVRGALR